MKTTCCIVGGGPAGVMLGYLLARAGVEVVVLEKHKDFFRDFRGDTIHPSTLEILKELGLLEEFLKQPHQVIDSASAIFGGREIKMASLKNIPASCPYVALMPQWDFLNFLTSQGKKFTSFHLLMEHEGVDLIRDGDRIRGVIARSPDGEQRIEADLVVACDGRQSRMREAAALAVKEYGVPTDVLWFRINRPANDRTRQALGYINDGKMVVLIDRVEYYQTALLIQKGTFAQIQKAGLEAFRRSLVNVIPDLAAEVDGLRDWDQIKLLTVQINRLVRWSRPGLLCIGDAAHAMSPVFGVGINLAIQDAVATANELAGPLKKEMNVDALLKNIQKRRELPVRVTQAMQSFVHSQLVKIFRQSGPMQPPWQLRLLTSIPGFQTFFARFIGIGIRPEHIRTSNVG